MLCGVFNGSSSVNSYNGSTTTGTSTASLPELGIAIGGSVGGTAYICEVIYFNVALTTAQRQLIEGYLAWKWGLQASLPGTHPYAYISPLIALPVASLEVSTQNLPTGLVAWFAADKITGVSNGSTLPQWVDSSGNGYNLAAGVAPTYNTGVQNGLPGVLFDGATTYLQNLTFNLSLPFTVYLVSSATNGNSGAGATIIQSFNQEWGLAWQSDDLFISTPFGVGGPFNVSPSDNLYTDISVMGFFATSTSIGSDWNASALLIGINYGSGGTTPFGTGFQIGYSSNFSYLAGYIFEILIFNSSLTLTQRGIVQGYLAWKWGTQSLLDPTALYAAYAPALVPYAIASPTAAISYSQNYQLQDVAPMLTALVTTTGSTAAVQPWNSSLFLQRLFIPGQINLSEVDLAIGINFHNSTSAGQGSMSQSLVLYSFGNSTSLASVFSTSTSNSWTSGSTTAAGSYYSHSQVGWSGQNILPFTFANTSLLPGEYVIGNLLAFAGQSTSWTVTLFGNVGELTASIAAGTVLNTTTVALTQIAVHAGSGITGLLTYGTGAAGTTGWLLSHATSATQSFTSASSTNQTFIQFSSVASIGTTAGSIITGTTAVSALSAVALASGSSTFLASTIPAFGFIGTQSGATTSGIPNAFYCGIMSTGGIPVSIAVTAAGITITGSVALQQPWFAIVGL